MSSIVKSADRVLTILDFLASRPMPVPTMVIARQCGLPRSSTYHLLNVLSEREYVRYYSADRRWGLGRSVLSLAPAYERTLPLASLARPILRELVAEIGGEGRLLRLEGRHLACLAVMRTRGKSRATRAISGPLYASAPGRAALGALEADVNARLWDVEADVVPWDHRSRVAGSAVHRMLREDAERGFSREILAAHGGPEIAAPVRGAGGRLLSVVSVAVTPGAPASVQYLAEKRVPLAAEAIGEVLSGGGEADVEFAAA